MPATHNVIATLVDGCGNVMSDPTLTQRLGDIVFFLSNKSLCNKREIV